MSQLPALSLMYVMDKHTSVYLWQKANETKDISQLTVDQSAAFIVFRMLDVEVETRYRKNVQTPTNGITRRNIVTKAVVP